MKKLLVLLAVAFLALPLRAQLTAFFQYDIQSGDAIIPAPSGGRTSCLGNWRSSPSKLISDQRAASLAKP